MTRLITFISAATLIGVCAITLIGVGKTDRVAEFTVRIEDVSNRHTLHTSTGDKIVGLSPGMWVLHTGNNPIYSVGARASTGLERLAEDGNPEGFTPTCRSIQR